MKKLLIADKLHPIFKEEAQKFGYHVDDRPEITRAETLAIIHEYTGIAIRTKFNIDQELIDAATSIQFIARAGAGMDNINLLAAEARNIVCINAPEGNQDAVGEHAIGMLLSLYANLRKADIEVRDGIWDREGNRGLELKNKTVGIIGFGHMGQSFAHKLSGFEVEVIAYDKYKSGFSNRYAKEVSMEQIVKHADILSLHIPLTRETQQMVDDEYLFHFKKPIILLNTARGEIVNTAALLRAIKQGKVRGAGLDVLEVEKFPALDEIEWFNELKKSEKVLLSPHVAGWTVESYRKISEVLAEKLKLIR
ncbi:D-3-phosphoglycerate dehydrogenase [Arcticibacter svalbardensis MN12-7]|uniref:D-3-phosphoglycerate dehydrogenase n=1 Tax=Arcticibacter svalbardensis MN12-7 TaxID=1150600 RepID=R9GUE4_9SPHI|nr:NAD(P)-dependent oxidoreductase [Arcticibacter svalbardensis]EOR95130.1 D-3-phosphoglycerate dehydrogenase [Arcticibacter svalbardensis MN12-7]